MLMDINLPNVPVHDLVIKKGAQDLIIATHGRSLYKANVGHLQQLNSSLTSKQIHMFSLKPLNYSNNWGKPSIWSKYYGSNDPIITIPIYKKEKGDIIISVKTAKGTLVYEQQLTALKGLNYLKPVLFLQEKYLIAYTKELKKSKIDTGSKLHEKENGKHYLIDGSYTITVSSGEQSVSQSFTIKPPRTKKERKPQKKIP
jgi:hypothetical protein